MRSFLFMVVFTTFFTSIFAQQNTILIIADDMATDYCGFYEDAVDTAKMPNVRKLLSKGVRFRKAWGTPYCSPTRAGILTGRYGFRTGVGTVIGGANSAQLDTAEMALPKLLKLHAPTQYRTAQVGKWHLQSQSAATLLNPNRMGYDYFSGNFSGVISNYYNWTRIQNGVNLTSTNYATTETLNDAISFLDTTNRAKPFFLWMGFNAPHTPFHKPPDSLHSVAGLTGTTMHINQNPKQYFKAMIEALDTELGRLFAYLSTTNRLDSTNIIFIGDNGQVPQVSQISDASHAKGTLYEYGVHVPMIISGPAVVNPNRVSDALVSTPDLFATILDMSGFPNWANSIPAAKRPVDSKSVLPILKNTATDVRTWNFTEQFKPTPDAVDGKAIRNETYKLIHFENNRQEFYNLTTDRNEQTNLLLRPLTAVELSNYITLCNQLADLVGGRRCLISSTDDDLAAKIKVYPTVFNQNLTIETTETAEYELSDALGRKILRGSFLNSEQLKTTDFAAGLYVLTVKIGEKSFSQKVVKQ